MKTRFDKLDYLLQNCNKTFIQDSVFLFEMVRWMEEDDFSDFFDKICRDWDITVDTE
jgi:hypothetical protein